MYESLHPLNVLENCGSLARTKSPASLNRRVARVRTNRKGIGQKLDGRSDWTARVAKNDRTERLSVQPAGTTSNTGMTAPPSRVSKTTFTGMPIRTASGSIPTTLVIICGPSSSETMPTT